MFKTTSRSMQRIASKAGKASQASRSRKLDKIFEARSSKATLGKLRHLEQGQEARAANLALKAKLRADAVDPAKAEARKKKIEAKLAERMKGVVVVVKKKG